MTCASIERQNRIDIPIESNRSTEVLLISRETQIKSRAVLTLEVCEELDRRVREACEAIGDARRIRRSKDMSFHEDVRLSREEHARLYEVIKHLLVGHEGQPCPAGRRPIVDATSHEKSSTWMLRSKAPKIGRGSPLRRESA